MKAITFKNRFNGEKVVCKDLKAVQVIDGIEYLLVSKTIQDRKFLMRKDALKRLKRLRSSTDRIPCYERGDGGSIPSAGTNLWCP